MTVRDVRKADNDVDPMFINRWSPRAYTEAEIPDKVLLSIFEAARWAPSARNIQPWRFVFAKRQSATFNRLLGVLSEKNQLWAPQASALIALLSAKTFVLDGKQEPAHCHSFDAGAAWANLTLQANLLGWQTRAMAAFDHEKASSILNLPKDYDIEVIIAIGKIGDKETLPAALKELEVPTSRLPLQDLVSEGTFGG
jgi:nitroreductase